MKDISLGRAVALSKIKDAEEGLLMQLLEAWAQEEHDGHLTIMRFTTNWRVGFGTADSRDQVELLEVGKTFTEAARKAIAKKTRPL